MNISPISFQGKIRATYQDIDNYGHIVSARISPKNDRILLDFMNQTGCFDKKYNLDKKETNFLRMLVDASSPNLDIPYSDNKVKNQTASLFGQYVLDNEGSKVPRIVFLCDDPKTSYRQQIEFMPDKDTYNEFKKETGKKLYFEC